MRARRLVALGLLLAACGEPGRPAAAGVAAPTPAPAPADPARLAVAAASSLRELLEATQAEFAATHGATQAFSFDASSTLSRQIEEGAPFDVFLSADVDTVDRIGSHVDGATRRDVLGNRLVLVGRADLPEPIPTEPDDLVGSGLTLALAGPAVPAGRYARAYLKAQGLESLEPDAVGADSVQAALARVESGTADCAIVYSTAALAAKSAKLLWTAPPADDPGITYVAVQVAGSKAPLAPAFLEWLGSPTFQQEARGRGFQIPAR